MTRQIDKRNIMNLHKPYRVILFSLGVFLFINPLLIHAEEDKSNELETVRSQIDNVRNNLQDARYETARLRKELKENEIIATELLTQVQQLKNQIKLKNEKLIELETERESFNKRLAEERNWMAKQMQATYKLGANDYIRLLLNQENPNKVGRSIAYYNYYNKARVERIYNNMDQLEKLDSLETKIIKETNQLKKLKLESEEKLDEFANYRLSRKKIIARINKFIAEQDSQLITLQDNERELEGLVADLIKDEPATVEVFEDMPDFRSLKGKLDWPLIGTPFNRFGAKKEYGDLNWQGILLTAEAGTEVKSIGTGKVVFADWFRNLGLLIILDHGNGYMSLYGHNQNIHKKVGDWVLPGEPIASAGDSGGQSVNGVYFELRKDGKPLNPIRWCTKLAKK